MPAGVQWGGFPARPFREWLKAEVVLSRLQRLGVELIDAPVSRLGPDLLNRYLTVKRASRL